MPHTAWLAHEAGLDGGGLRALRVVAVCHLRMLTQMLHALVRMLHAQLVLEVIADVDRSCCYFISTWPEAESKYVCLIGARAPSQ